MNPYFRTFNTQLIFYYRNNGDSNHGNVFECDDQVDINRNSTNQVSTAWCSDDDLDDISFAEININSPAWLHSSSWNPSHETVVLIHGYGGTADHLPAGVLRDGKYLHTCTSMYLQSKYIYFY